MCEALIHPLEELASTVQRVLEAELPNDPVQLGHDLTELRRLINQLEVAFSSGSAAFAKSGLAEEQGYLSPLQWVRHNCQMTGYAAAGAMRVGEHLPQLRESVDALARGEIGFAHLALMGFTAQAIEDSGGGSFDEGSLLRQAKRHLPNRFRKDCAHVRHAANQRAFLREQEETVAARTLTLATREDGCVEVDGFLDAEGGALVRTALEPLAARNGAGDARSHERRLADALVELAEHRLDQGDLPVSGGTRPHLQVTCSLETLRGQPGSPAAELESGGMLAAVTVQRLACDAYLTRIVLDADSQVLDVGRTRRTATVAQRKALRVRDGGCVWPGCDRPASWTVPHHQHHWSRDRGPTSIRNLLSLCHRHHRMVHEGGWELVRADDGRVVALPPLDHYLPAWARAPDYVPAA
jgi:hypothetical protein